MNQIVSFSGGKDSTAMLLMMLEKKESIHSVVWFDTGWEYPQIYNHIKQVEGYAGISIVRLKPKKSFDFMMHSYPVTYKSGENKGKIRQLGNGWPCITRRWCTRIKCSGLYQYTKGIKEPLQCIGIAYDERVRAKSRMYRGSKNKTYRFPLIEWQITEKEALEYCYSKGFTFGGLYNHFNRVSCWCCPLQTLNSLRTLRKKYPKLWGKLIELDKKRPEHNVGFRRNRSVAKSVMDLEKRFNAEDKQLLMF